MSKASSSFKKITASREAVSGRFVANPSDAELVNFLNKSGLSELGKVFKRASTNTH